MANKSEYTFLGSPRPDAKSEAIKQYTSSMLRSTNYPDLSHWAAARILRQMYREALSKDRYQEDVVQLFEIAVQSCAKAIEPSPGDSLHWENRIELADAYSKMQIFNAAEGPRNMHYIWSYGMLCYALERFPESQKAFEKVKSSLTTPDWMCLHSQQVLSVPKFMHNRVTRGNFAWRIMERNGSALLQEYRSGSSRRDFRKAFAKLSLAFHDYTDLNLLILPEGTFPAVSYRSAPKAQLMLYSSDMELDLIPMELAIEQMPDSMAQDWDPCIGRPPVDPQQLFRQPAIEGVQWEDLRITISDSPDHTGADLFLWHPYLLELAQDGEADAQYVAQQLVCMILGDLDAAVNLRSLTISPNKLLPSASQSLPMLPQLLKGLGYSLRTSPIDLEQKLRRTYTRTPDASDGTLRSDITAGWTDCWRLVDEYEHGRDDAFVHYLNMGIGAGFLVWPKSLMAGSGREEFMQKLTAVLDKTHAFHGYRIIGEAESPEYCYLDLLLWTVVPVVEGFESFFRTIPGGSQVRYQAFRRESTPGPVTVSYFRGAQGTQGVVNYTAASSRSGFVPSTSRGSSNSTGKKGKRKKK